MTGDTFNVDVGEVEAFLESMLADRAAYWPADLLDAVRYAVMGPGKRVRPAVVLLCEAAVPPMSHESGPPHPARPAVVAAAAIELVHTFSLVHDDLPAMDDDDLRRGRPTLHKREGGGGEAMAILAGDVMLSLAFEVLARHITNASLSRAFVAELSLATSGMIAGQVMDTLGVGEGETGVQYPGSTSGAGGDALDRLRMIHRHKTGTLIRAACTLGGLCGGPSERQLEALQRYGESVGLLFQVVDDLLDVTRTADEVGKATGKDAAAGKLTYPGLLGVDATRAEAARLLDEAITALEPLGEAADPLRELAQYVAQRER